MIFQDPPYHTLLRALVSRAFTPRRITALEARIRELVAEYLDPWVGGGSFDFVQEFAAKLPAMVIGSLLGVPEADQDTVRIQTDEMLHIEPGETLADKQSVIDLYGYWFELIKERRAQPRDDMITALLQSEIIGDDGEPRRLDDMELLAFIGLLSGAGNETVAPAELGGGAARAQPRPARCSSATRGSAPERGRGAAAVRGTVADPGPLGDPAGRDARRRDPGRVQDRAAHRERGTRRARVSRRRPLRRAPHLQPSRVVRLRPALLPGCRARPARSPGRARGDARPLPDVGHRRVGPALGAHQHRARLRDGAVQRNRASRNRSRGSTARGAGSSSRRRSS